jgi:hypothetical protein
VNNESTTEPPVGGLEIMIAPSSILNICEVDELRKISWKIRTS